MKRLIIVAAALFAGSTLAADNAATPASFESLDRNADGRITAGEAAGDRNFAANFSAVDADSDGAVSKEEFAKWEASAKPQSSAADPEPAH
ncbi:MAG: hypothetical protein NAOJABEB_02149 [Steroidobacteraceae bacterium]|nr:hypothetical protein [Steroidobacteraceae bacterium]